MVQFRRTEQNRTEHVNYVVKRVICQPLNRTFSQLAKTKNIYEEIVEDFRKSAIKKMQSEIQ